jgi:glycerol-3-phosphate dehydrogenase
MAGFNVIRWNYAMNDDQSQTPDAPVDMLIVGGGINGAGIARDAAGRGLSVVLCEKADLASATSSASSKLIHGGLRYLEFYEFGLVRKALREREVLMGIAPHLIQPLRFIIPHDDSQRPMWLMRLGLVLYDHLYRRQHLEGSRQIDLTTDAAGQALDDRYTKGLIYSDCQVDDARLVITNALDAAEHGADIRTRCALTKATREGGVWKAELTDVASGETTIITAKVLVNAAGPWVSEVLQNNLNISAGPGIRLVQGSHLVVPKLTEHEHAYVLQNADQRIVFVMPWGNYSLIGTTELELDAMPEAPQITEAEIDYLLDSVNGRFKKTLSRDDIVWTYAGVRPLFDDDTTEASAVTRDFVLDLSAPDGAAPLLSVFGGKVTAYRELAEQVIDKLAGFLPVQESWTAQTALPGGDIGGNDIAAYAQAMVQRYDVLPPSLIERLVQAYGSRVEQLLQGVKTIDDMGTHYGGDLFEREVQYLINHEWAQTADDIVWRRSKLGLVLSPDELDVLAARLRDSA